ncbi:TBC-domain-containing protein [Mycena sanguinolenta]|uniref:TBC-domain-containing protein n=1 Tax=Mycena sanguinolenta TaxID=230812 RepID=A0A8H6ZBD9_9AGAR|nr:TBC-domain-containing protein [Mycena sanguinolenta]
MSSATAHSFNKILNQPKLSSKSRSSGDIDDGTKKLRRMILVEGIPSVAASHAAWTFLRRITPIYPGSYSSSSNMEDSPPSKQPVCGDIFAICCKRTVTLATDRGFKERVREDMLIRLLDAFTINFLETERQERQETNQLGFTYVQGMNVLAAPFLYTMPSEVEAFYCFSKFIEESCPLYVQPTLEGVHRGLKLLDRCLKIVDPELFAHLRSKNLSAEIYAFPSVLTLCACTPPLDQVLQLWDFLLAFGVHLNVLCVIAQLLLIRDEVMASSSPMRLLRTFPPLEALPVIGIAVTLVRDLPAALYEELVKHPYEIQTPH